LSTWSPARVRAFDCFSILHRSKSQGAETKDQSFFSVTQTAELLIL
jgi:hypothetical protein